MLIRLSPLLPRRANGRLAIVDELPRSPKIYEPFRENDATMKTRLPKVVWHSLSVAGDAAFQRRAAMARELVFLHLYGRYDFEVMKEYEEGFFYHPPVARKSAPGALYDIPRYSKVETHGDVRLDLGRSSEELVLAMPELMHKHVMQVAFEIDRTPARTLRQIIVNELFGRYFMPEMRSRPRR